MSPNRRDFIKYVIAGSIAAGCPIDLSLLAAENPPPSVEGEGNTICHQVRDEHQFTLPPVSAKHDYVIVGGGISGLTTAYLLRDHDFLLLEKEPHFGGNAYVMDYKGMPYATGAAFIWSGDIAYTFAKEIGLESLPIDNWDGSIIKGEFIPDTWGEGLDKLPYPVSVRDSFKKFRDEMLAIDLEKRRTELFNVPFSDFLKGHAPEVKQWWDNFGPSNWGCTSDETAATSGIAELQAAAGHDRKDYRYTWPGGNGAISKKLAELMTAKASDRMAAGATTIAVVPDKNEVRVTYIQDGKPITVAAKAAIMASPKFITRRMVKGLPEAQSEAMHKIRYIPYPVVNVIFDKPVFNKGYDTWCPGNTFTDFIVADWVVRDQQGYQQKYNILTFYTPMKEEDRGYLLTEESTRKVAARVLADFQKLFPGSNVDPLEVHIYRRGHPLYMTTPGLFTKVQPEVRHSMDRVFFANTDSEGPESTSGRAIAAAYRVVKEAQGRLAGKRTATAG